MHTVEQEHTEPDILRKCNNNRRFLLIFDWCLFQSSSNVRSSLLSTILNLKPLMEHDKARGDRIGTTASFQLHQFHFLSNGLPSQNTTFHLSEAFQRHTATRCLRRNHGSCAAVDTAAMQHASYDDSTACGARPDCHGYHGA